MSYEGYEQCICKNGHLFVQESYAESTCECGEKSVYTNSVDDTNCDSYGYISDEGWRSLLIEEQKTETCPCCAHTKVVALARYRNPKIGEAYQLRMRRETLDSGEHRWVNIHEDNATREVVED